MYVLLYYGRSAIPWPWMTALALIKNQRRQVVNCQRRLLWFPAIEKLGYVIGKAFN